MDHGTYTPRPRRDPRRRRRQLARRRLARARRPSCSSWRRSSPRSWSAAGRASRQAGGRRDPEDGRRPRRAPSPRRRRPRCGWRASPIPCASGSAATPWRGELGWALGPMLEKTKVFKPDPLLQGVLGHLPLGLLRLGQADGDRHAHRAARRGGHDDGHQRHAVGVEGRHVDLVRHVQVEDQPTRSACPT